MKTRIYCDANPTPLDPLHPVVEYMANNLGFERMFIVVEGTLQRAPVWCDDDMMLRSELDWSRQGNAINNFSNPPQERCVKMCATLASNGNFYRPGLPRILPITLDIENASVELTWDDPDQMNAAMDRLIEMVYWVKHDPWQQQHVGLYYFPQVPPVRYTRRVEGYATLAGILDFVAPSFYTTDHYAVSPQAWFDGVSQTHAMVLDQFNHLPRVAVICPLYQIYHPALYPSVAAKNNQPADRSLWRKKLQFLVNLGYQLCVWVPEPEKCVLTEPLKVLLGDVNAHQL